MTTDPHKLLVELSDKARSADAPIVDVRHQVMKSVASRTVFVSDVAPLAFSGLAVGIAASVVFAFLPLWLTMAEPWICYFPQ